VARKISTYFIENKWSNYVDDFHSCLMTDSCNSSIIKTRKVLLGCVFDKMILMAKILINYHANETFWVSQKAPKGVQNENQ